MGAIEVVGCGFCCKLFQIIFILYIFFKRSFDFLEGFYFFFLFKKKKRKLEFMSFYEDTGVIFCFIVLCHFFYWFFPVAVNEGRL